MRWAGQAEEAALELGWPQEVGLVCDLIRLGGGWVRTLLVLLAHRWRCRDDWPHLLHIREGR